jgi:hypothetical protein
VFRIRCLLLLMILLGTSACNAYGPKPTPAQSPTPKPTVLPAATVGPLSSITLDGAGLTLMVPSSWGPPQTLADGSIVISADGSTNTTPGAAPFVYIIPDAVTIFRQRLNSPTVLDDPVQQLNKLIEALNRDAPRFPASKLYEGGKYPAASTVGFERNNQLSMMLMNAGNGRWLYIGTQAPELYYSYYNEAVFKPVINSITLKTP